jgi:hypothetical protein
VIKKSLNMESNREVLATMTRRLPAGQNKSPETKTMTGEGSVCIRIDRRYGRIPIVLLTPAFSTSATALQIDDLAIAR